MMRDKDDQRGSRKQQSFINNEIDFQELKEKSIKYPLPNYTCKIFKDQRFRIYDYD